MQDSKKNKYVQTAAIEVDPWARAAGGLKPVDGKRRKKNWKRKGMLAMMVNLVSNGR